MRLKSIIRTVVAIILTAFCMQSSVETQQRPLMPNMRLHNFRSDVLAQTRHVLVWLPPGYNADSSKRYPVFYMHDGQNKYLNWRIDETAQALIEANKIEPLILVGVYHGGSHEDRFHDYTPTHDPNFRRSGKADDYGRMLVEELKPFIDSQYRTLADSGNTGLGGASLGGLVSLYLGLKYPTVFGRLALMSPSVWWDDRVIIRGVKKLKSKLALRIWLDVGTAEGDKAIEEVKDLRKALVEKGWKLEADLKYFEDKGADHSEKAFARRAAEVLKYLFPPQKKGDAQ
jgi:predicted alpha/beta superfamily hydrolase